MSSDKFVYIQNTHNAPITCNARGENGEVVLTKKFMPALTEKLSGKILHSGYEKLTGEEYEALVKTSRTFQVYSGATGKAKLLVAHDELPAEAKTPHEALVDARKDARKAAGKIAELEGVIVALKAQLLDEQTKYKELSSASTDGEKLKPLNDKIAELEAKNAELEKVFDALGSPEDKTAKLTAALLKFDEVSEVFASKVLELAKKTKGIEELVADFRKERDGILTLEEVKEQQ